MYFEIIKVKSKALLNTRFQTYGCTHSVMLDDNNELYYSKVTQPVPENKFYIYSHKDNSQYDIENLAVMLPDELFQYSLVCPYRGDIDLLKKIQEGLMDFVPKSNPEYFSTNVEFLKIEREIPDYMLSDDEFYDKHFPGKKWRD
ncbi:hypothetical protein ABV23_RS00160 [Escherichia coli]|nr:hypothetical protein [Escherichia coli]